MTVVVLPAYNEAAAITQLLHRVKLLGSRTSDPLRVIVVDDGSSDSTSMCVREFDGLDCTVVTHPSNLGLGAAMLSGLQAAARLCERDDVIVTMDADDTHSPAFIRQMTDRISEGYDIVIASRYRAGSRVIGVSIIRRWLSSAASCLFRLVFPIEGVRDYTCGYRAYRAELIQGAFARWGNRFIDRPGFSCMVDVLLKLSTLGPIVTEIPFLLRYDRKQGQSKMHVRKTVLETAWLLMQRRMTLRRWKEATTQELREA